MHHILLFSELLTAVIFCGAGVVNIFAEILLWKQNLYTENYKEVIPPPPLLSFPTPCRSPGGGGGPSLGQPKIFRCASLRCCVGDCVVGHCHLYPLHSWRDILLTFAEMELDSTTMFPLGTNVTDDDSDLNSDTEVSFGNKLYFTRHIPEGKRVPKNLLAPAKPPTKKAKPPPKSAAQSIPVESGEHMQDFKVKCSRTKKFYTEPVKE